MNEISRNFLETYAREGEVDGGWIFAKALQQAKLDYSDVVTPIKLRGGQDQKTQVRKYKASGNRCVLADYTFDYPFCVNTWKTQNGEEVNSLMGSLFLRVAGAPLDNNVCERALKKAILHRNNAYFYRTLNGARVGDVFMSLIHTAELNRIPPFDYLVALQRHADAVAANPADWMPWNYQAALANLNPGSGPPA